VKRVLGITTEKYYVGLVDSINPPTKMVWGSGEAVSVTIALHNHRKTQGSMKTMI